MKHTFYLFAIALLAITLSTSSPAKAYTPPNQAADCKDNSGTSLPINSGVAYLIIVGAVTGAVFLRKAVLGSEADAKANY